MTIPIPKVKLVQLVFCHAFASVRDRSHTLQLRCESKNLATCCSIAVSESYRIKTYTSM